jgi:hypothetical protein
MNHEVKHVTLAISSLGTDEDCAVATLFAGINTAPNHISNKQFSGWMTLIQEITRIYKESPLGKG